MPRYPKTEFTLSLTRDDQSHRAVWHKHDTVGLTDSHAAHRPAASDPLQWRRPRRVVPPVRIQLFIHSPA